MNEISQLLPLLIPIIFLEIGLMIWALIDLIKQPATRGPKWMWVLIIIFVNFIGPIIYFIVGREEG
jgi:hypothetical protein